MSFSSPLVGLPYRESNDWGKIFKRVTERILSGGFSSRCPFIKQALKLGKFLTVLSEPATNQVTVQYQNTGQFSIKPIQANQMLF